MTTPQPYPLAWPPLADRIAAHRREKGKFSTTLQKAIANATASIRLFAGDSRIPVKDVVLSSNASLGIPSPADPGVALWFTWDGEPRCIAVDRYQTLAANVQAIHLIVEARRVEARHGTLTMLRASFQGLRALSAPAGRHWQAVLGLEPGCSLGQIEEAFKRLAKQAHPDAGGSAEAMAELIGARREATKAAMGRVAEPIGKAS